MTKETGNLTHRATDRGYDSTGGQLIEIGEPVPAGLPISENWMEPVKKADRALAGATDEALDPHPKDVDITVLNVSSLQTMAAERGINVEQDGRSLTKKELIAAITAHREKDAG